MATKLKCPYCKQISEQWTFPTDVNKPFWCVYCGEQGIIKKRIFSSELRVKKPTRKEYDAYANDDEQYDSNQWLPPLNKKNLHFEIVQFEGGYYNPDNQPSYDFTECERYLKLLYHKTGITPQVNDEVFARYKDTKGRSTEQRFYIIGRTFATNDYDVIQLIAVRSELWEQRQPY